MPRFDVHRPAVIEPTDYEFVCNEAIKIEGIGDCHFIMAERARLKAHMARTGGKYANHEHGGNCHVCGAAAIYTVLFHHAKTNTYIRTGGDCAEKLGYGDAEEFRKKIGPAVEAAAGKKKAKAVLEAAGLGKAWEIVADVRKRWEDHNAAYAAWRAENPEPVYETDGPYGVAEVGAPKPPKTLDAEHTVEDIVRKLVKYGDISDKAMNYLRVLIEKIEKAPALAAARAAEAAAAKPVPVTGKRMKVVGEVLHIRETENHYGLTVKMLLRHADGWKLWGTVPGNLRFDLKRGNEVEFEAKVTVSDNDPKFGFFSRPTKARFTEAAKEAA